MTSSPAIVTTTFNVMADPAENNGRTPQSDLIIGSAMIILSVLCAIAYSVILVAIWRDKELIRMTSYKFMFVLGWCDVIQCFPHAVTGIFTIYQSTGTYWIAKARFCCCCCCYCSSCCHCIVAPTSLECNRGRLMGVCATPFYNGYAVVTVMLSINRFIQLAFPQLDQTLFSPRATMVWIGVAVGVMTIYFVALLTPWAAMTYDPKWYGWSWDFTLPASFYLQKMAMSIQVGGIILSGFFYIGVVIMLLRTRKRFAASRNYNTEVKILIQAGTITVYCSILNILWHNYKLILPDDLWTYCALNFMWILNSGVYPIIYFIVNSALRGKIVRATKETRKRFSNSFAKGDSSKVNGTSITRIV